MTFSLIKGSPKSKAITCVIVISFLLFFAYLSYSKESIPPIPKNATPKVQSLIEETLSKDIPTRANAAHELVNEGQDAIPAIPFLIRLLDDGKAADSDSPSCQAFGTLEHMGKDAVQPLIDQLSNAPSVVQCVSIVALLRASRDPQTVDPLVRLLNHHNWVIRQAAACALGNIPDPRSAEPLIARLNDSSEDVRVTVINSLGRISDYRAVDPLIALLDDKNPEVVGMVLYALARIPDGKSFQPLFDKLNEPNFPDRASVAIALGALKDSRSVKLLISFLQQNEDNQLCISSAHALGDIGDSRAVEPLITAYRNAKDEITKSCILQALSEFHDPRTFDLFAELIKNSNSHLGESSLAAKALGYIHDVRSTDILSQVWQNEKENMLIRITAATAMGHTRDQRSLDAITFVLKDGTPPYIFEAIECLADIRDPRAKILLEETEKSKNEIARLAAKIALEKKELSEKIDRTFKEMDLRLRE
jgi:HEAT repeat protein